MPVPKIPTVAPQLELSVIPGALLARAENVPGY